jgi:hypothetical protein
MAGISTSGEAEAIVAAIEPQDEIVWLGFRCVSDGSILQQSQGAPSGGNNNIWRTS